MGTLGLGTRALLGQLQQEGVLFFRSERKEDWLDFYPPPPGR